MRLVYNPGNGNMYVVNQESDTVSVIGTILPTFKGIFSQVIISIYRFGELGNNVGGQSGDGISYSDSPTHQGQSTNQDSSECPKDSDG